MTARSVDSFVIVLPDPGWDQDSGNSIPANSSISFSLLLDNNLQSLSTNTASAGSDVEGLLYVPDLFTWDPCFNLSKQYIPQNVTRRANLPATDYYLIAYAPWFSPNCTKSYLESASSDGSRGFIFYIPDNATYAPPPISNPYWDLNDGGQWKSQNKYPAYAIPGFYGASIMQQLALYSGNMTDAPNGHLLSEQYDSRDYVRLYVTVSTGKAPVLPSLWVFLLIVLGMLLGVIFLTSLVMHYFQRRRRQELQRMIAIGEVDLEALSIKRVKVPQEVLNTLPLFVYVTSEQDQQPIQEQGIVLESIPESNSRQFEISRNQALQNDVLSLPLPDCDSGLALDSIQEIKAELPSAQNLPHRQLQFAQGTCPICLEDFVSHETTVRQLPCAHIYHPECIDTFLRENSSLCPMCKGKVLPRGYCPTKVTNAMVRREQLIRRMRERVTIDDNDEAGAPSNRTLVVGRRMASFHRQFGRGNGGTGRRMPNAPAVNSIEMTDTGESANASSDAVPPQRRPPNVNRRDWARRRVNALLRHQRMTDDEGREIEAVLPASPPELL